MPKRKPKPDCCWETLEDAKWVSRATWVCPKCGKDVSLAYVLMHEAMQATKKLTKKTRKGKK